MKHQATSKEDALNYAIYLLNLKMYTEGQIREKLKIKKYELRIADEVINKLKKNKYINDQRYAEVYLESLKSYKNFGYYGIKKKLMEKRLPEKIIESVLQEGLSLEDEIKIAKRAIARWGQERPRQSKIKIAPPAYGRLAMTDKPRYQSALGGRYGARQKTAQRLKSRGFRNDVISNLFF